MQFLSLGKLVAKKSQEIEHTSNLNLHQKLNKKVYALLDEFYEADRINIANQNNVKDYEQYESKIADFYNAVADSNKKKQDQLNKANNVFEQLVKNGINGLIPSESEIDKKYAEDFVQPEIDKLRLAVGQKFGVQGVLDPVVLFEKFCYLEKTLKFVEEKLTGERTQTNMLKAKMLELALDKDELEGRMKKKEFMIKCYRHRFPDLQDAQYAASNKLKRAQAKVEHAKQELEIIHNRKEIFMAHKNKVSITERDHAEDAKRIMAKNFILLDDIKDDKKNLDSKLDELEIEERKIFDKKKHSKLVLDFAETMNLVHKLFIQNTPDEIVEFPADEMKRSTLNLGKKRKLMRSGSVSIPSAARVRSESSSRQENLNGSNPDISMSKDGSEAINERLDLAFEAFFMEHGHHIEEIVDTILKKHIEMSILAESLKLKYEDFTASKQKKEKELERQQQILEDIQDDKKILSTDGELEEDSRVKRNKRDVSKDLKYYTLEKVKDLERIRILAFDSLVRGLLRVCETGKLLYNETNGSLTQKIRNSLEEMQDYLINSLRVKSKGLELPFREPYIPGSMAFKMSFGDVVSAKMNQAGIIKLKEAHSMAELDNKIEETNQDSSSKNSSPQKRPLEIFEKFAGDIEIEQELDEIAPGLGESWKDRVRLDIIINRFLAPNEILSITKQAMIRNKKNQKIVETIFFDLRKIAENEMNSKMHEILHKMKDFGEKMASLFNQKKFEAKQWGFEFKENESHPAKVMKITQFLKHSQEGRFDHLLSQEPKEEYLADIYKKEKRAFEAQEQERLKAARTAVEEYQNIRKQITELSGINKRSQSIAHLRPQTVSQQGTKNSLNNSTTNSFKNTIENMTKEFIIQKRNIPRRGGISQEPPVRALMSRASSKISRIKNHRSTSMPSFAFDILTSSILDLQHQSQLAGFHSLLENVPEVTQRSPVEKDPEEGYIENTRKNIIRARTPFDEREIQKQENNNDFKVPSMMRVRYHAGWDGMFRQLKEDKNMMTRLSVLHKKQSDCDIKSKDTEVQDIKYIPDLKILRKLKTLVGSNSLTKKYERPEDWSLYNGENSTGDMSPFSPKRRSTISKMGNRSTTDASKSRTRNNSFSKSVRPFNE